MNPKVTGIVWKLALIVVAVMLAFYAGAHFKPLIVDSTMSPGGIGQSGWPLPFAASFWDDSVVNPYQAQQFNIVYFVLNVGVFYLLLFLLEYVLQKVLGLVLRGKEMNAEKVMTYIRYALLIVLLVPLAYWGLSSYFSAPQVQSGVTENAVPTLVQE